MKIIGLMLTWNNLEFLRCSLPQALDFCDELIVVEGCHSHQYPKRSTDGTCEYIESIKNLPRLRVMDFDFRGRYDTVQRAIRLEIPKTSEFYKPGNWVFHWDDDGFFMEEDLPKLRTAIETTECDSLSYIHRNFIYNFRFNSTEKAVGGIHRLVDGFYLSGANTPYYKNNKQFTLQLVEGVTLFHYSYVKKPERFNARMVMSIEKETKASIGRYEQWMSVRWKRDEDIFKSQAIIESIRPGGGFNIYKGKHPESLANHPWRYIKDVRNEQ